MFLSPFALPIFLLPVTILGVFAGLIVMGFAVVGGPSACEPGGSQPVVLSEASADSFQRKWDDFDTTLDSGSPATVTFTESEIASRAMRDAEGDLNDLNWLQNFRVCLHDGYGEISGTVNLPSFLDLQYKAKGTAHISDNLVVDLDKVEVGSIPGFVSNWVGDSPNNDVDLLDKDYFADHSYTLTLREGEAEIAGVP